jgi:hypothetical protein
MKDTTMTRKGRILRSRGNQAGLPELERMLTVAAAGQVKESSVGAMRRIVGARPSRIVAIGAACLAFGGSAMAASGVWDPGIGTSAFSGPPSTATTPVPAATTEVLAVLRREPTARDRSSEVEATLRGVSGADGVRPDSVRYLGPGAGGDATVLLSAEKTGRLFTEEEPICVYRPMVDWGAEEPAHDCFDLAQLLAGQARITAIEMAAQSGLVFGLVPDGVATVTAEFGSAPDVTVPVANNYWEMPVNGPELSNAHGAASVQKTVWRDADGQVVPQQ